MPLVTGNQGLVVGNQFGKQAQHKDRQEQQQASKTESIATKPFPSPAAGRLGLISQI
jgi:hypothetical protein